MPSSNRWRILFFMLQLHPVLLFKIKLVKWLIYFFLTSLGGCAEDPVPQKLWDRLLWYKKRVIAVLKLYQLLSEQRREKR